VRPSLESSLAAHANRALCGAAACGNLVCAAFSRPPPLPALPPRLSRARTTARCAEAAHSPALAHALSQAASSCSDFAMHGRRRAMRNGAACRARHAAAGHGAVAGCRVGRQRLARAASAAAGAGRIASRIAVRRLAATARARCSAPSANTTGSRVLAVLARVLAVLAVLAAANTTNTRASVVLAAANTANTRAPVVLALLIQQLILGRFLY
jgi:hypothetical protein